MTGTGGKSGFEKIKSAFLQCTKIPGGVLGQDCAENNFELMLFVFRTIRIFRMKFAFWSYGPQVLMIKIIKKLDINPVDFICQNAV